MTKIFLCYRSGDDAYAATLLDEKLSAVVGRQNVFRDNRSVEPGQSYAKAIMAALEECDTVLAVIGPTWLARLDHAPSEEDWVRIEITTALRHGKRVIPLLLSRTPRLAARDLPPDIADVAYKQYLTFDHRTMDMDLTRLVAALDLPRQTPPPTEDLTLWQETWWDGSVELDVVRRNQDGTITGRLSGRAQPGDFARMAELIVRHTGDRDDVETGTTR